MAVGADTCPRCGIARPGEAWPADSYVGRVLAGEGMLGLTRAFFHSGARFSMNDAIPSRTSSVTISSSRNAFSASRLAWAKERSRSLSSSQRRIPLPTPPAAPPRWAG